MENCLPHCAGSASHLLCSETEQVSNYGESAKWCGHWAEVFVLCGNLSTFLHPSLPEISQELY